MNLVVTQFSIAASQLRARLMPRWGTAVLIALLAGAGVASAAESLLPDGSLELDKNADQWPDGWARPKVGGSWPEEAGNHFLRLTSGTPGEMVMLYQQVSIPAGVKALELTWKMRVSNLKRGKQPWFDTRIMMDFKDAGGAKLKGAPAPSTAKNTDGWVERSVQFVVPEGARTLDFMPALFNVESGIFDLDNVTLKPIDPAAPQAAAKAQTAATLEKQAKATAASQKMAAAALEQRGSLISNGDMESDKKAAGWPDDWARPKSGASWEQEAGNHFIRLQASSPGATILLHRLVSLPKAQALELSWRQRVTDLKVGKEPYFDARLMLEFHDAAGKKLPGAPGAPNTRKSTDGWVERKAEFLVPEGAVDLALMPALFQVLKGTFDLDDMVLKPITSESLLAKREAAEAARKAAAVPAEAPQRAKWPQELHVEGNRVLAKDSRQVWLQGVNVVSLEWSVKGEQVMKSAQVALELWKANIIRLPVKESYWFGEGAKDGGAGYRELVDSMVTFVANRGAYLLLDLHRYKAPKAEHAAFWKDAAARYQNHPAVLFDLMNEPHGTSWEVWRDGGFVAEKKKPADEDAFTMAEEKAKAAQGFQAIGMQALLDTVRATGARNVVLVGGLDYAYDLSGIAKGFALKERGGHGIIYSTHIYPWKKGWQEKVLVIAGQHPLLVGEVGANTTKMSWLPAELQEDAATWVPEMLGFIQKHRLHWTAFSFHPKAAPTILTGWDYTPTPEWGTFVKRALAGEKFELKRLR